MPRLSSPDRPRHRTSDQGRLSGRPFFCHSAIIGGARYAYALPRHLRAAPVTRLLHRARGLCYSRRAPLNCIATRDSSREASTPTLLFRTPARSACPCPASDLSSMIPLAAYDALFGRDRRSIFKLRHHPVALNASNPDFMFEVHFHYVGLMIHAFHVISLCCIREL
jgi:hypothetical protein